MGTVNCSKLICFYFLLVCNYSNLLSQDKENYYIKTYTTENGLAHNNVYSITQDKTGFLWIATWDGLSRFDGYEFKNYYHTPGDSSSLNYFLIRKVLCDFNNNVWIRTDNKKLNLYNRKSDDFLSQQQLGIYENNNISDILLDPEKKIWIQTKTGMLRYNYPLKKFQKIDVEFNSKVTDDYFSSSNLSIDNHFNIWIINDKIYKYKLSINEHTGYPVFKLSQEYTIHTISTLIFDNFLQIYETPNHVWLFSNRGLFKLDTISNEFIQYNNLFPFQEFSKNKNYILAWDDNGINILTPGASYLQTIQKKNCYNPTSLCIDNNQTVWFGSVWESGIGLGLKCFITTPTYFNHYLNNFENENNKISVFSIHKDRYGDIWTGLRGSTLLYKISRKASGTFYESMLKGPFDGAEHLRTIAEDSSGLWFGYNSNILSHYSYQTKTISHNNFEFMYNSKDFPVRNHSLLPGDSGKLLIGSSFIYEFNPVNKTIKTIWVADNNTVNFTFTKGSNGFYWLGKDESRLYRIKDNFKESKLFQLSSKIYNIESICEGNKDEIWIATLGGGISKLNTNSGKNECYTTANGLSNNTTYSILKDKNGYIWISSDKGISRFNPKTNQFRNYGYTDGLKIEEFNSDAVFEANDGEFFFGGMGGIVSFYPDSITEKEESIYHSDLVVTDIKVSGISRYFDKPVYETSIITLNKGDNNFTISFACLNLRDANKILYRYRTKNINSEWVTCSNNIRYVNYTHVKPGKYVLDIEATDILGNWSNKTQLTISIPPFFYQTFRFLLLIIIIVIICIFVIIRFYINQVRLKEKQASNQLRLDSLRGQMNPHFIFNSLNSINYFISQNDRLSANRYIADFSRLIRSILDNMACNYITLDKELESLEDYLKLEYLRFSDKFDYKLNISELLESENIEVFPGMVQPFIENAIWHGVRALENRKGFISVQFLENRDGILQCIVDDDGVGRKHTTISGNKHGRRSRGISIVNERLKIYNNLWKVQYKIEISDLYPDKDEPGTHVIIDIPIKPFKQD